MTNETISFQLNPTELKAYQATITEMAASLARMAAERELMKEAADAWKESHDIKPKTSRAVAKILYEASLEAGRMEADALYDLAESVITA